MITYLKKNKTALLLLIFVVAGVFLRAGYLSEIKRIPFFDNPVADSKIYYQRAMDIREGKIFPEQISFHSSALYPYYIALTYSLTNSLAGPRIIQMAAGVLNIIVVFFIMRILFGSAPGLIAAFFMGVYPVFIYFEGDLMMISLVLFTMNLSCLMFVLYQARRKKRYLAMGGFFIALTAMGKPDTIMLAPFAAMFVFFIEKGMKRKLTRVGVLTFCVCVTLVPLVITNYLVEKKFVLLTSNGGVNFFIGNHEGADGLFHLPAGSGLWDHRLYLSSKETAERELGKKLTSPEVSEFWFKKSVKFILSDMAGFIKLFARKMVLMINRFEVSNHHSFYFFRKFSNILKFNPLGLSFFMFFAPIGLIFSLKKWRNFIILYGYLATLFFFTTLFFVTSRYRLPTVTFYIMFASLGIYKLFVYLRMKQFKKIVLPSVISLIIFIISLPKISDFNSNLNQDYHNLGNVYLLLKQYGKAIRCYERVECKNPNAFFTHFNKGNVYRAQKQYETALSEYFQEIEKNPQFAGSYFNAGYTYQDMGNPKKAVFYLEKALQLEPSAKCFINLGYLYHKEGEIEKTISIFKKGVLIYPNNKQLLNGLRICYNDTGQTKKAEKILKRMMDIDRKNK
ncbi:tetratricopeptide repeat protein [bacterium]|nr:tetratricopeptide repeat protein [bacterium]